MKPEPPNRRVEIIAHRGLHSEHRENTLQAFEAAISAGADAIELDVHASSDGEIVVHHDPTVSRPNDRPLKIADSSAVELQGSGIPTLTQVLEQCTGRAKLYIEVKAPAIELLVARAVRHTTAEIAIHSFDHRVVKKVRDFVPGIQTGILTVGRPVNPTRLLAEAAATDYWPQVDFVDADLVGEVHSAGGHVIVWTANDPTEWERLVQMNVDGICTDHPDRLRAWFLSTPHKLRAQTL